MWHPNAFESCLYRSVITAKRRFESERVIIWTAITVIASPVGRARGSTKVGPDGIVAGEHRIDIGVGNLSRNRPQVARIRFAD